MNAMQICRNCGSLIQGSYCPGCGEGPQVRRLRDIAGESPYVKYLRYYPDMDGAVRALRKEHRLPASQARHIIGQLFTGDKALARREDSSYYIELYRPDRAKAVRALRQELGFSALDAQTLVDAAYTEEPAPQTSGRKAGKAAGKALGLTAAFTGVTAFKIVKGLVKDKYK